MATKPRPGGGFKGLSGRTTKKRTFFFATPLIEAFFYLLPFLLLTKKSFKSDTPIFSATIWSTKNFVTKEYKKK